MYDPNIVIFDALFIHNTTMYKYDINSQEEVGGWYVGLAPWGWFSLKSKRSVVFTHPLAYIQQKMNDDASCIYMFIQTRTIYMYMYIFVSQVLHSLVPRPTIRSSGWITSPLLA